MNGHIQRAGKKVRQARLLLEGAAEQAPELDLASLIAGAKGAEDRAAQILRRGLNGTPKG